MEALLFAHTVRMLVSQRDVLVWVIAVSAGAGDAVPRDASRTIDE